MTLYFVNAEIFDNSNADLLVIAKTPKRAVELWRDYFEVETDDDIDGKVRVFRCDGSLDRESVLGWHQTVGMNEAGVKLLTDWLK